MKSTNRLLLSVLGLTLAACAGTNTREVSAPQGVERTGLPFSSPECLAAKLPPGEAFPASAIPAAAQANRQSGVVTIRYDVMAGVAQNLQVVSSSPAGLYDAAAMQHAAKYRAPNVLAVRGCVTVIDVKF
jgi:TonB family protein